MARSKVYDPWDDLGMQFTPEQLAAFDPSLSSAARANTLIDLIPVVVRRAELRDFHLFWKEVAKAMTRCARWYLVCIGHPRLNEELLLAQSDVRGDALRQLTVRAHNLAENEEQFIDGWRAELHAAFRMHVTLGRRCESYKNLSSWTKSNGSMSNKVANAFTQEVYWLGKCDDLLSSLLIKGRK